VRILLALALVACSREPSSKPVEVKPPEARPVEAAKPAATTGLTPNAKITSHADFVMVDLAPDDGPLRAQVLGWLGNAKDRIFMVETTAKWCRPCIGFTKYAGDPQMTKALAGVTLARIDIDQFDEDEIKSVGLSAAEVPWFVLFDDELAIQDAITSGEWDDDVPENMAPVLGAFAHGTYTNRRHGKH
jgi:hypothetical protein